MVQLMPFVFSGIFFLTGILFLLGGFTEYKKKNLMRNTPTSKIASAAMGEVEIKGEVVSRDQTLISPLSREECIMYEYEVEEYRSDNDGGDWITIDSGEWQVPFYVDDGTGKALVRPEGADFKLPADESYEVEGGTEPPEPVRQFIEENEAVDSENKSLDLKVTEVSTGRDRKYTEYYIGTNQDVYVFGNATNENPEGKAKQELDDEYEIVVRDFDNSARFMISDLSEEKLISRTGKNYLAYLVIGFILSVIGFGAMLGAVFGMYS